MRVLIKWSGRAGVDNMLRVCVALTLTPSFMGVLALKIGPMFDERRTRALVTEATSLRPFFVPNKVMA